MVFVRTTQMTDALSELARERRAAEPTRGRKKQRVGEPTSPARAPPMTPSKQTRLDALECKYKAVHVKLFMHTATTESLDALRTETVRLLSELYQLDPATMFRLWAGELDDTDD